MAEETSESSGSGSTSITIAGEQPQQLILNYSPSAATRQQFNADFPVLAALDDLPKLTASLLNNTVATLTEVGKLMSSYAKLHNSHAMYDAKYFDL
jgi:pyruvate kinase